MGSEDRQEIVKEMITCRPERFFDVLAFLNSGNQILAREERFWASISTD
jgi:hypothetical protein